MKIHDMYFEGGPGNSVDYSLLHYTAARQTPGKDRIYLTFNCGLDLELTTDEAQQIRDYLTPVLNGVTHGEFRGLGLELTTDQAQQIRDYLTAALNGVTHGELHGDPEC